MTPPRFYGDTLEFLRQWAICARAHPSLGLHAARAFEQLIEHLLQAEASQALILRDLHRDIECLEAELEKLHSGVPL